MAVFETKSVYLVVSAIAGTGAAVAQTVYPDSPSVERLGVAGLLVAGAYFMLRYFMAAMEKKDAAMEKKDAEYREETRKNTALLVEYLEAGHVVQRELTVALGLLTQAVRERHR